MFKSNLIGKRVMAVIKNRIAFAQKQYDEIEKTLDESHIENVRVLEEKLENSKSSEADRLVEEILGKIL